MPVLHLLAGPHGAGKTTFFDHVLGPATHLAFINADLLALEHWPGDEERHGHEASALAEAARHQAITQHRSFITETVFSHPSKLELVAQAQAAGYLVTLHVMLVPEALTVERVRLRAAQGGHRVPSATVRARYRRLWPLLAQAVERADQSFVYDNSRAARPFRRVAQFEYGQLLGRADLPAWSPLRSA